MSSINSLPKEEKPSSSVAAVLPPHQPPPPVRFAWTMELTADLLESVIMDFNENGRILQVGRKSLFAPLKLFACYHKFCKRAFNGNPPEGCTIAEFERKMVETLPPFLCQKDDGTETGTHRPSLF